MRRGDLIHRLASSLRYLWCEITDGHYGADMPENREPVSGYRIVCRRCGKAWIVV